MCSGGASAYYSHSLQLLLFSYMNGVCVYVCVCVWVGVCVRVSEREREREREREYMHAFSYITNVPVTTATVFRYA